MLHQAQGGLEDGASVLERNPEALTPVALPGYLWIAVRGRATHIWTAHFDMRANTGEPS